MFEYQQLLGRRFTMGEKDCFSLVIDFFKINFDIDIKNYARPTDWNSDVIDIIGLAHPHEGFEKVLDWEKNLQPADVLCMALGTSVPNHYAVNLGGNEILHHLYQGKSLVEPLRGAYRKSTCYVLRHKQLNIQEEELPSLNLVEFLRERNSLKN
jgi:cell wall-associated NlpC family hydrolase